MAYFVTYQLGVEKLNVILKQTHPVDWAARRVNRDAERPGTPVDSGVKQPFILLFWKDFPQYLIDNAVQRWCQVED